HPDLNASSYKYIYHLIYIHEYMYMNECIPCICMFSIIYACCLMHLLSFLYVFFRLSSSSYLLLFHLLIFCYFLCDTFLSLLLLLFLFFFSLCLFVCFISIHHK